MLPRCVYARRNLTVGRLPGKRLDKGCDVMLAVAAWTGAGRGCRLVQRMAGEDGGTWWMLYRAQVNDSTGRDVAAADGGGGGGRAQ